jgi:hypothetical protein
MLPSLDTYLLGYRKRDLALDPLYTKEVAPGGGIIHPTLVLDGRIIGTWRYDASRRQPVVRVRPFERVTRRLRELIEREADDISRFLDHPAELEINE